MLDTGRNRILKVSWYAKKTRSSGTVQLRKIIRLVTSTNPRYIDSILLSSSSFFNKLSLHKMALDRPRASAVELDMFSTTRCFTFFNIKSSVLPWEGSAWSLLYRIVTDLSMLNLLVNSASSRTKLTYPWVDWISLATSDFVFPFTLTLSTPIISSPLCNVPSLAAGELSKICNNKYCMEEMSPYGLIK